MRAEKAGSDLLRYYEATHVAWWRTEQVKAATAAGIRFIEPGATCVNERAEAAEAKLAAVLNPPTVTCRPTGG